MKSPDGLGGVNGRVHFCQICKKPVVLETARINEHGKAVHEDCYVNSLKGLMPPPNTERPPEAGA
jgi:hypothetical protein